MEKMDVMSGEGTEGNVKQLEKERVLEALKTEPLKYVLEVADVTNAGELVDQLSKFETKAGFEKVFFKLKELRNLEKVKIVYKSLNYITEGMVPGKFYGPTHCQYNEARNTLYIDEVYSNSAEIGDFYISILHELFHEVFKGADKASAANILFGLPNIGNTLHKLPIHNTYRHLYSTVLRNVSKEDKEKHYGLSSVDEFISEAYANPAFQKFLKTVELQKKRNVVNKTTDLLLSVVTLNARVVFQNINEKDAFSAFQKVDLESLDLLEDFEKNMDAYTQGIN